MLNRPDSDTVSTAAGRDERATIPGPGPAGMDLATLAELMPGEPAEIHDFASGSGVAERVRLLELGFLPGGPVAIVRRAPFGCPLEVDVAGTRFSMRRETARSVLVRRSRLAGAAPAERIG